MTNPDENKLPQANRKLSNVTSTPSNAMVIPGGIPSACPSHTRLDSEPEKTYIFPGLNPNEHSTSNFVSTIESTISSARGHSRSVSHGGGAIIHQNSVSAKPLKSALRGHQRALSHGQIPEVEVIAATPPSRSGGHNRAGSKTDFILPPSYKGTLNARGSGSASRDLLYSSSIRGHSRQASRSESIYTLRRSELPPWWKRLICGRASKLEERGSRIVVPNHTVPANKTKREHPNGHRVGNKIRTTKYTLLSFIPKNLLEQFHRVANLYFIFIVLLNWFPQINAFGKEIAMIPVLFVLGVTALKDLFEDRRRRASDRRINNSTCRVYNSEFERYKKVLWQDVRVGDLIHLSNNETVPADILLLRTSDSHGVCYIDTCDLDGETNLKRREVVKGFKDKQKFFIPSKFKSRVEVDIPSTKIYRFHGAVLHATGEKVPVASENLLLRESRLKNTDFIEGLVVYAGHETKAMLNNSGPRYKRSQIEQQMNIDVIWCVLILIILCLIGAVGYKLWLTPFVNKNVPFLPADIDPTYEALLNFWTFVIILQIMIPLSLYVTIELSKILQVYHIHNNIELYDSQTNKQTECRAMNITEELGQIQYVFSDKTGTLTENKMIFRRCSIAGVDYNHLPSELEKQYSTTGTLPPIILNQKLTDDMNTLVDQGNIFSMHAQKIHEFLLVLAVCNTVVVSKKPHRDLMNESGMIEGQNDVGMLIPRCSTEDCITNGKPTVSNKMKNFYSRLTEPRSIVSSSSISNSIIPPKSLSVTAQHTSSLSPICSSSETTPTSESPNLKIDADENVAYSKTTSTNCGSKSASNNSMLSSISSILSDTMNTKTKAKRLAKVKVQNSADNVPNDSDRPIYEAESPDELALVNAAYSYNCCLLNRTPTHILLNHLQEGIQEYEILKLFPFDSNRKCMSIVVRRAGSQDIILYTKGADSSLMSRLAECSPNSAEGHFREKTQQQLDSYARQGLRVLVVGKRQLSYTEFNDWLQKHQEHELSLEHRERTIRESFSLLERNLTLLGATGIEDRLQEGVPETISSLLSAGIVVWVLTGDKLETAINVAYSAKLFSSNMELLKLTARSRDAAENSIMFFLNEIEKQQTGTLSFDSIRRSDIKGRALVVDGKTLTFILDLRSNLTKPFLKLTKYCSSVLCCRSTPLQKAFLVKIVKEELKMSTLAIGDGANDVSMIQMADVGVGISGQEGMQAVMASDFTLGRFRLLERLLLVHGHWCYDRLARMILFFFYKNASFVFLIFWYQLYCGFSGTVMIDQMYLMLYNFVFTSLPPIAIGVYDKNITEDLLMKRAYLYKHSRCGKSYKSYSFWIIMLDSLYQSLVIFFVAVYAYWDTDVGIWEFGTTIGTSCLVTMLLHCAIEIQSWTILHLLSIVISLGSFYAYSLIYNAMCVNCLGLPSTYWVIYVCISSIKYWLVLFLTVVIALLPRVFVRILQATIWPSVCVKAILDERNAQKRGEDLLVTWSRSTSASSIYRTIDQGSKTHNVTTIAI